MSSPGRHVEDCSAMAHPAQGKGGMYRCGANPRPTAELGFGPYIRLSPRLGQSHFETSCAISDVTPCDRRSVSWTEADFEAESSGRNTACSRDALASRGRPARARPP